MGAGFLSIVRKEVTITVGLVAGVEAAEAVSSKRDHYPEFLRFK
jgi:hypothetical protein